MDIIRPRIKDVATLFFSSSSFFEPKYLAVTILNPVPQPLENCTINSKIAAVAPIAASALSPKKCPTNKVSIVL